eukprot:339089-Alexandrium_andersonii.AAC.1
MVDASGSPAIRAWKEEVPEDARSALCLEGAAQPPPAGHWSPTELWPWVCNVLQPGVELQVRASPVGVPPPGPPSRAPLRVQTCSRK